MRNLGYALLICTFICMIGNVLSLVGLITTQDDIITLDTLNGETSVALQDFPQTPKTFYIGIECFYSALWLIAIGLFSKIGFNTIREDIFSKHTYQSFAWIGYCLLAMSLTETIAQPTLITLLNESQANPAPPLSIDFLAGNEIELFMVGIFFTLIGKIFQKAKDLEETEKYTV